MRDAILIVEIILFLLLPLNLSPQSGKLISADEKLSNSLIYKIYQDKNDLIWIATEDGLNRYDGAKYTIYRHNPKDSLSIGHNFVRFFYEDSRGNFFIGHFKGLQRYHYATDCFENVKMFTDSDKPVTPHVTSIIERKNGDIIIGTTGDGVYILKEENGNLYARQINEIVPSKFIICIYEDKDENLWVSTEDKGLYMLTQNNNLISFFRHNDIVLHNISSICEDREGNLLVGSMNRGLMGFNRDDMSFFPIDYPENPHLPVKTLFKDNLSNDIYLGTDGHGIKIYNPDRKKITDSDFNVSVFDLDKSKVHTLIRDKDGNFWLGIYQKGVILLPAQANYFAYTGYKSIKRNIIGSNCIMSLREGPDNIVWVGTDNDGLYGIYPNGRQYAHYTAGSEANSIPATIMCIYIDSNRDMWVGSYLNGMGKVNPVTGRCEYVTRLLDDYENPVQRIYSITEDKSKRLWIGTMGSGLFSMDLNTGVIVNHNRKNASGYRGEDNMLVNEWIESLLYSSDNKLYVGTYQGLACLDLETDSYLSAFGVPALLEGLVVYALYEDMNGNIWAGTAEGLMCIDKTSKKITAYTTEEGLPSNVICAINGDKSGNLWISTHYGISQLDTRTFSFLNYYASDGLQGNEFSKRASIESSGGQIMFGGPNGITSFNPRDIVFKGKKLDIRITDFYIHDRPVRKGSKSGSRTIIDTSVSEAEVFHLSHNDNSFSIELSAMNFTNPDRITYMYRVDNDSWVTLQPGINSVYFSNLAPGRHHFVLKAKDYKSFSGEKRITVTVYPPWFLSIWMKLLYALLLLFIISMVVMYIRQRYRTRQKMIEHKHAEEINEAKLQFFMNIAHEIRTPMTLVISPLKRLMATDKDKDRQHSYKTMKRNSERILSLINQLLDIRKIDKGIMSLKFQQVEIISFIQDIYTYYEYYAKTKNITFLLHTEIKEQSLWVDHKNFDKIILNVLSNAFKYTPENGKIDIYLRYADGTGKLPRHFEISIADNGIGIADEEKDLIFDRYYQIKNSYNSSKVSTGIGLHLTRSLVELHHGTIQVEDNEGKGSRFIIRIPLGKEHLTAEEIENDSAAPAFIEDELPLTEEQDKTAIRPKTKYRVMIVEDDDEIRKYICEELAEEYHMLEYANGKEALNAILRKAPDLVISDIMMPDMDGITLCAKIKQNININHIPVVLITARSKEEDNLEGLSIGADAYIVKPFSLELLKNTIKNLIRNRELLRNSYKGNQHQEERIRKINIKTADEKLMEKVMKTINDNLSNPELSVEMIAENVGISRVHLHRKLKELTNQSTRDLIRNIRLKQAAHLLSNKGLTVKEVADATGFSNIAYFSNAFKLLYGVSPTVYMEERNDPDANQDEQ